MSVELEGRQPAPGAGNIANPPTPHSVPDEPCAAEGYSPETEQAPEPDVADDYRAYRAMSSVAMAAFGAGILAVFSLMNTALGVIPFVGIVLSIRALQSIRRRPDELTGTAFARAGLALSLFFLLASWGNAAYEYATEVRKDYQRISYTPLQPEATNPDVPPRSADELDGKKVFIKGYVYPYGLASQEQIKSFLLVRDNGTCCFGGTSPKPGDTIQVTLTDPLRLDYTPSLHKLHGTFRLNKARRSMEDAWYLLDGDYVE